MQKTNIAKKTADILFSYWTTIFAFFILASGAAVATFLENDFGTSTARVLVYNSIWYETALVLSIVNLIGIINRRKMWKQKAKFIFHSSFVVILIGAAMTRYIGYEGIMKIQ
ncbi:MAG: cytochrome C biogenesis protein, partial [Arcobacteraceae bacterium]